MSATIRLENFGNLNIKESSKFDADILAGATAAVLAFTDNMAADDYLYLGRFSAESSELVTIDTVTDAKNIVLASPGTTKPHSRFDPVSTLFGNQINIYRAPNVDGTQPADAAFAPLEAIDIDFDQSSTDYTDPDGSSGYWYKFTYLNETSSAETTLADSPAVRGGGVGDYCSVDSIRDRAGLKNNRYITDPSINEARQAAQNEINATLSGLYTLPFSVPVPPIIKEITRDLAAGYVLLADYGPTSVLDTTNGQAMIDKAREKLLRIRDKELILTNEAGSAIVDSDANTLAMWPDATTGTNPSDPHNGAPRMFTTQDRY